MANQENYTSLLPQQWCAGCKIAQKMGEHLAKQHSGEDVFILGCEESAEKTLFFGTQPARVFSYFTRPVGKFNEYIVPGAKLRVSVSNEKTFGPGKICPHDLKKMPDSQINLAPSTT